ncbi:MAG: hypothetical protein Q9207_001662 [Kuettlingeria erythrocarpa]
MCYHEIEKFDCGHEEKHKIPCEDVCESKSCAKAEEDQIRDHADTSCTKCKHAADEAEFIQEELRKFVERESLNPTTPSPTKTRDPNAPKLYFKRCLVWTKCGHHSHPRPSDIERDEGDPEYMHVEGRGNCFDCSAAPTSTIVKMKQDGQYNTEDPWGAMTRVEIAEGSSRGAYLPSLEEIGQGIMHAQAKHAQEEALESPPPSPVRSGARPGSAASSEPQYDMGPTKGKGRSGVPIRQPSDAATVKSDGSDLDDDLSHSLGRPAHVPQPDEGGAAEPGEGTDDDLEEESDNHRVDRSKKGDIPHWGHETMHDHGNRKGKHQPGHSFGISHDAGSDIEDEDEDEEEEEDEDEDEGQALASPEELQAARLPPALKWTKVQLQSYLRRKDGEGQLAMIQHRTGAVKDPFENMPPMLAN